MSNNNTDIFPWIGLTFDDAKIFICLDEWYSDFFKNLKNSKNIIKSTNNILHKKINDELYQIYFDITFDDFNLD